MGAKVSYNAEAVKEFIRVNHGFYTVSDVAEELKIHHKAAKKCWTETGLKEFTSAELLVILIKENAHLSLDKLVAKSGYSATQIKKVAADYNLNITIRQKGRPKPVEIIEAVKAKEYDPIALTYVREGSLNEAMKEADKRSTTIQENRRRFAEYTQLPTTFSEINDIRTRRT